jgi:ubiquinone/menaquinone biosynthesis C-methylase UbiE
VIAESIASLAPGATLLDIGSGPGTVLAGIGAAVPGATLVGVEPSEAMRAIAANRGIDEIPGSAESLPLPDASVDLAISSLSMHHWEDPAAALRELRRVLRPGGSARIYDVRFAAYSPAEVASQAAVAGIEPGRIERTVLPERILGLRPYVRITIHTPTHEESNHAG